MNYPVKTDDVLTLTADNTSITGDGICVKEGLKIFVSGLLQGETAELLITETKKSYAIGEIRNITVKSDNRRESDCPVYSMCGGCSLRHTDYTSTLRIKNDHVKNCIERIGGITYGYELEDTAFDKDKHYRNKAEYHYSGIYGFKAKNNSEIIDARCCLLQPEYFAKIIETISVCKDPLIAGIVLRENKAGDIAAVVCFRDKSDYGKILNELRKCERIVSVHICIQKQRPAEMLDGTIIKVWGRDKLPYTLSGIDFDLSPRSFFQINSELAEKLYVKAIEYADIKENDFVIDSYCGAGAIGMLAAKEAKKVIGIESVYEAVEDAKATASRNGIDNITFLCGKCEEIFPGMKADRPDIIFIDPPRKGCDKLFLKSVCDLNIDKIVYVSCDAATLARDIKYFSENGYKLIKAAPFDMFPYCAHVEAAILMTYCGLDKE